MSGRRSDGGDASDRTLGQHLKHELHSAFQLLFKNLQQQSVDLHLEPRITSYLTAIPAQAVAVSLEAPTVQVSLDPIRILHNTARHIQHIALIDEAPLAEASPCTLEPILCREPVFNALQFESFGVSFENLAPHPSHAWRIEPLNGTSKQKPISKPVPSSLKRIAVPPIKAQSRSLQERQERLGKAVIKSGSRFYSLPVKKMPVPPHRFSLSIREQFRKALAEKAGTKPTNVQLRIIFPPMNMALYANIQQDEQGNLLCTPKNEFLGQNLSSKTTQSILKHMSHGSAYLVFGFRLDTKAEIRALVPASSLPEEKPSPPSSSSRENAP